MAIIMDGSLTALHMKQSLKYSLFELQGFIPKLAILCTKDNPESDSYVKGLIKDIEYCNWKYEVIKFPQETYMKEMVKEIHELNKDKSVNGIMIARPLPNRLENDLPDLVDEIEQIKDIESMSCASLGYLNFKGWEHCSPCTSDAIIRLLKNYKVPIQGKHCVIINRSVTIGRPLSAMLLNEDATVTICHSKTKDLMEHIHMADILITATGHRNFINGSMIKDGACVIDAGIKVEDGKVYGDCDFESVEKKASYITPVPGGVGPVSRTMVLEHLFWMTKKQVKWFRDSIE